MKLNRVVYFGQSLNILDFLLLKHNIELVAVFVPQLSKEIHQEFLNRVILAQVKAFYVGLNPHAILEHLPVNLDLGFCAHFEIIPQEVLDRFRMGVINIHPAPLPKYAGRYPLIDLCLAGDMSSGVSIHWMSSEIDQGDLIADAQFKRHPLEGPVELEKRAEQFACHLLSEFWDAILDGYAPRQIQVKKTLKKALRTIPSPCKYDRLLALLRATQAYGPYGGMALYEESFAVIFRLKSLKLLSLMSKSDEGLGTQSIVSQDRGFSLRSLRLTTKLAADQLPTSQLLTGSLGQAQVFIQIESNWELECDSNIQLSSLKSCTAQVTTVMLEAEVSLFDRHLKPLNYSMQKVLHDYVSHAQHQLFLYAVPNEIDITLP